MDFKVNKKLLPLKGHYFLFNAGTAPVVPFMPTLARQLGFSSVIVGTIYLILPIIGMVAKPVFGAIADRYHKQKMLFILFQFFTAIAFMGILFITPIPQSSQVEFHCNDDVSDFRYCPKNGTNIDQCVTDLFVNDGYGTSAVCYLDCDLTDQWMRDEMCTEWFRNESCPLKNASMFQLATQVNTFHIENIENCLFFVITTGHLTDANVTIRCPKRLEKYFKTTCQATCTNSVIMEAITEQKMSDSEVLGLYQFWWFFMCMAISWAGMAVVVSVGDAICFEMLGDKHKLYGNQRLWGSIGWGVFSLIAGALLDEFSKGKPAKDYTIVFNIMLVLLVLDMILSTRLQHTQTKRSPSIFKDVGKLFLSSRVIVYFIWCIVIGLCTAMVWNFLFWHLEDLADANESCGWKEWMKTLQGLAMAIQCFGGELPFFFLSGPILKKIGHIHSMSLVLVGFGVRFMLYSVLTNPWWVLPIELMNGITFGIFYATMTSYAKIVAPPGTEATLQGLVGAIFEGVGVSTGSFFGGVLMQQFGGSQAFRIFSYIAFGAFIVHAIVQFTLNRLFGDSEKQMYAQPMDAIYMMEELEPAKRSTVDLST